MKHFATLVVFSLLVSSILGQEVLNIYKPDSCKNKKIEFHRILSVGYLVHCECKTNNRKMSRLFQVNTESDSLGTWINQEYQMSGSKLKVKSVGTDFVVVKVVGKSDTYRYSLKTKSWSLIRKVTSGQTRPGH